MKWLSRIKDKRARVEPDATEPTNHINDGESVGSVGYVASILTPIQKIGGDPFVTNAPVPDMVARDPDRWCWPKSTAMTSSEIDLFKARLDRFTVKGVIQIDA